MAEALPEEYYLSPIEEEKQAIVDIVRREIEAVRAGLPEETKAGEETPQETPKGTLKEPSSESPKERNEGGEPQQEPLPTHEESTSGGEISLLKLVPETASDEYLELHASLPLRGIEKSLESYLQIFCLIVAANDWAWLFSTIKHIVCVIFTGVLGYSDLGKIIAYILFDSTVTMACVNFMWFLCCKGIIMGHVLALIELIVELVHTAILSVTIYSPDYTKLPELRLALLILSIVHIFVLLFALMGFYRTHRTSKVRLQDEDECHFHAKMQRRIMNTPKACSMTKDRIADLEKSRRRFAGLFVHSYKYGQLTQELINDGLHKLCFTPPMLDVFRYSTMSIMYIRIHELLNINFSSSASQESQESHESQEPQESQVETEQKKVMLPIEKVLKAPCTLLSTKRVRSNVDLPLMKIGEPGTSSSAPIKLETTSFIAQPPEVSPHLVRSDSLSEGTSVKHRTSKDT